MTVADVVRRNAVAVTLQRPGAATITAGRASEGAPTVSSIQAVVQPLGSDELRNVPEGQNSLEWRNIWTETELLARDVIVHAGRSYTVQRDADWNQQGGFYHAQAVRVQEQAGS